MQPSRSRPQAVRPILVVSAASLAVLALWAMLSGRRGIAVAAAALLIVVLFVVGSLVVPARLVAHDTSAAELSAEQRATAANGARGTIVQGTVGLLALLGIAVGWLGLQNDRERFQVDREQLSQQLILTRQGQVAERFTHAVDQLSNGKLELRLGGIYGLEQIAREPNDGGYRLVVFEVLTAYVRQHARRDPKARGPNLEATYLGMRAPDVQAAITVLGRRMALATDPPLDFSDADLSVGSFAGARLQGANFIGALLPAADFTGADLRNAFLGGVLLWNADFTDAQLQGANLGNAETRDPDFHGANCDARTILPEGFECTAAGAVRPSGVIR